MLTTTGTTLTKTTIPVRLQCEPCSEQITIMVATRGTLAALTNEQRDLLDEFTRTHSGHTPVHRPCVGCKRVTAACRKTACPSV